MTKKKTININLRLDNNLVYVYGMIELIEQLAFVINNELLCMLHWVLTPPPNIYIYNKKTYAWMQWTKMAQTQPTMLHIVVGQH